MKKVEGEKKESLRKIVYYGEEVASLLREDLKFLTLRMPNTKYDLEVGEVIEGECPDSNESVRLVVIDNIKKPLREFTEPELLLDGYLSLEEAVEDLGRYYSGVEYGTVMQGVLTMREDLFDELSSEERATLLEYGMDAVLDVDQHFKEIFWDAWCGWVMQHGGGVMDWRRFLETNDLAQYYETSVEFDGMGREELFRLWKNKGTRLYRMIVLMEAGKQN